MAKARRIKGIDCDGAASAGIRLVLSGRLKEMIHLRDGALNWDDAEGVHSMRVASRRLRSALRDFTPYLRKRGLASSTGQIRRLAHDLGSVRDQDVAILALEQLTENAPTEVSALLNELIEIRKRNRDKARIKLTKAIAKTNLKQLASAFTVAIDVALARADLKRSGTRPVPTYIETARAIILDRLKELEKLSSSLYRPLRIKPLHDMRIAAKRLRYAIELLQECWGKEIVPFAEEVARLQTALGELHDCDVWIENFGDHILQAKKSETDQSDAYAWLLTHFFETRNRHFNDAFDIWREWEARGLSAMLRKMIAPVETNVPATDSEQTNDSSSYKGKEEEQRLEEREGP